MFWSYCAQFNTVHKTLHLIINLKKTVCFCNLSLKCNNLVHLLSIVSFLRYVRKIKILIYFYCVFQSDYVLYFLISCSLILMLLFLSTDSSSRDDPRSSLRDSKQQRSRWPWSRVLQTHGQNQPSKWRQHHCKMPFRYSVLNHIQFDVFSVETE